MRKDQFRLRRALDKLAQQKKMNADTTAKDGGSAGNAGAIASDLDKAASSLSASITKRELRAKQIPSPSYDDALPVVLEREHIKKIIDENQVVILCGETGSGKTTQLPKICLELGRGVSGLIGHTQPRRIAARSVAARIAEELQSEIGKHVGFKVRFSDQVSDSTYIKLMTDGILLAETQNDRFLEQYDTIIIDEAHERSLNIDFLLGYIRRILPKRPDLKVIITSATIDPERFSKHFNDAPMILVEGRTYPVETCYRPLANLDRDDERETSLRQGVVNCVDEILKQGPGDILVFLPGERDIREVADYIGKQHYRGVDVLPLYGRLSASDQQRIFKTGGQRRIVLSTNVAETSITVPGIVYVIDSGLARLSRYSYRSKVQRLPIEAISQASANQRKGRCGRVAPGVCYRLYDEEDFEQRPEFTEPEILRTNLAEVILQMESLRLGDIYQFPFIDMPDTRFINDGYKLLFELGALSKQQKLTKLGQQMARLPIDPKLSRMLIAGGREHALDEALTITAVLSIQDPRERPHEQRGAADEKHEQWRDERSDFIALLNLWMHYNTQREKLTNNQLRKWCKENFLSYIRMREWNDTRKQLVDLGKSLKLKHNSEPATYEQIHRALLTGLLGNIGQKDDKNIYLGPRNRRFQIFPGSGVKKKAAWLIAAEIFETSKIFAHTVAEIEPRWLEQQAEHLLKRTHFEPHFHRKSGHVKAFEKVSLYGLIINPKKRVNYGPVNPVESRAIFIRDALANMELESNAPFMRHNRRLLSEIETLEAKARRRDLILDDSARIDFFEQVVTEPLFNAADFDQWRKQVERDHPHCLFLNRSDCIRDPDYELSPRQFPDVLDINGLKLPISYHFHPGAADDGVSLHIPVAAINQVPAEFCEWLVPGLLEGKIAALIKSLPKSLRTNFVPAPAYAKRAVHELKTDGTGSEKGSLSSALAYWLSREAGKRPEDISLNEAMLEEHYRMRFVVADGSSKIIGTGRNLKQLQKELADQAESDYYNADYHELERDDITRWDFGKLPAVVEFEQNGISLKGYPALMDMDDSVSIRLIDTPEDQQHYHREGLRKLFQLNLREQIKYLRRNIPDIQQIALWYAPVGNKDELIGDVVNAVTERVFLNHQEAPDNQQDFELAVAKGKSELIVEATELSKLLVEVFREFHSVRKRIKGNLSLSWVEAVQDIDDQLEWLLYPGFLSETPAQWLKHYPRYLKAINLRLDKLDQAPDKDRLRRAELLPLWDRYQKLWDKLTAPQTEETRWAIEELRVSQFAQQLKTHLKVSVDRVESRIAKLEKQQNS